MQDSGLLDSEAALAPLLSMAQELSSTIPPTDNKNLSTIRTLVMKALSDPSIFCGFDQLSSTLFPSHAGGDGSNNTSTEANVLKTTLELFSYGTYKDYTSAATQGTYLSLTDAQMYKLRQLTVLTLVQRSCLQKESVGIITYQELADQLELAPTSSNAPASSLVEDLVVSCIYAGVLSAQLCQRTRTVRVDAREGPPCRPRDAPPSQIAFLSETLLGLSRRLETTLAQLEASKLEVKARTEDHEKFWKHYEKQVQGSFSSGGGGGNPNDKMSMSGGSASAVGGSARASAWEPSQQRPVRSTKRSRGGMDLGRF